MKQRTFFITTLGCKVNQYEAQSIREAWTAAGFAETDDASRADLIVVNSCAITAAAAADTRNTVRRLHKCSPEAEIIVTGCAAAVEKDILAALPGVVRVTPQKEKTALLGLPGFEESSFAPSQQGAAETLKRFPPFSVQGYDRSRAVLKIQDGCSHGCAYCIVPQTRGGTVSRPEKDSMAEGRRLLEAGFRELVISGVNLRQYRGETGRGFWDFLKNLDAELSSEYADKARFRISSLEPGQLDERALETLSGCRMVAPQLHLSLQSGSPSVLRRMNRGHYGPEGIAGFLEKLRDVWPVFGLGADFITGFPGETDAEHAETAELCRSLPFTYAHVFPYSVRPGTAAASMPGQVGHAVKKERAAELRALFADKKENFLQSLLRVPRMSVALEDRENGLGRGVNEFYADCRIESGAEDLIPKGLVPARPLKVKNGLLLVTPLNDAAAKAELMPSENDAAAKEPN